MKRIVIFGNSGSGKSTLARRLSGQENLPHLDLDTLAWQAVTPPQRKPLAESLEMINSFMETHESWIIEGCYSDLLDYTLNEATELVYLDLPVKDCLRNAKSRPWESHKYVTKQQQDANLPMLLDWIARYDERDDTFSRSAHQNLYKNFSGIKHRHTSNENQYFDNDR